MILDDAVERNEVGEGLGMTYSDFGPSIPGRLARGGDAAELGVEGGEDPGGEICEDEVLSGMG